MPIKKSRTRWFEIKRSDITNMVDALFSGVQDDSGWVEMYANVKGRECVNALFPKAHIAWADDCGEAFPRDWRAFLINLPDAVAVMETRLPLEITSGADLDDATPDALAILIAIGVQRQGVRCAVWQHSGHYHVFAPHAAGDN
ncbi:MAG: hypothetical protein WA728_37455 [Xanthobacteraceae bacterium]